MRDWEDEPWVKLYQRDEPEWLMMPLEAQSVLTLTLRKFDRAGFIHLGRRGLDALPALLGHPTRAAFILEGARYLIESDGCWKLGEGGTVLFWPNYYPAQTAKSSDRARQQLRRERDRDAAQLPGFVSPEIRGNRHAYRHEYPVESEQNVTSDPMNPNKTSRLDETRRELVKRSFTPTEAVGVVQTADQETPLDSQPIADPPQAPKERKPRKKSAAIRVYDFFREERAKLTDTTDQKPAEALINKLAGPLVEEVGAPGFKAIVREYLADQDYPKRAIPPWPWALFLSRFGQYRKITGQKSANGGIEAPKSNGFTRHVGGQPFPHT